jgi:hypothetical protein
MPIDRDRDEPRGEGPALTSGFVWVAFFGAVLPAYYIVKFAMHDFAGFDGPARRLRPILGLKTFGHAAITIAGVELLHRIRKNQFALSRLRVRGRSTPEIWNAVLAA